jgi:predicted kinase
MDSTDHGFYRSWILRIMGRAVSRSKLILVCGLPGTGKTTRAKQLEAELGAIRLSADDWMDALSINLHEEEIRGRIEALQWKLGRQLLAAGLTVIIEWGTWGRAERDQLRAEARYIGASVYLHYLSAPVETVFERIQRRGREEPPIERGAIVRWFEMFEAPTAEEMALFDAAFTSTI